MDSKRRDNDDIPLVSDKEKLNYIRKEVKLEIFKRSFSRTGAILWNQISPNWRDVSKPTFKKTSRRFLFETLSDIEDYVENDTLTQFLNL